MNNKTAGILNLLVSIVFAVAILLSSYLNPDPKSSQMITFALIAIWWIPFSYLTGRSSCRGGKCTARSNVSG